MHKLLPVIAVAMMATTTALAPTAIAQTAVQHPAAVQTFSIEGMQVEVIGDLQGFRLDIVPRETANGVYIATLTLTRATPAPPPRLAFRWSIPSSDISGIWTPDFNKNHAIEADWSSSKLRSSLTGNAPVTTLFGRDERNRLTVALSDALNPITMAAKVREEDAQIYSTVELFTERHKAIARYSTEIRFDTRPLPFHAVLKDVTDWWTTHEGYAPVPAPAGSLEPLDSTWYSYHQHVDQNAMIVEAAQAAKLGFKVFIVDDGWQTNDVSRGYAYTGDWRPDRLADMKGFTDHLHAHGMKGLLWFSVPFVGDKAEAYERFKGKYLERWAEQQTNILDPRYPEVRAYLIETFKRAVKDWGWDGLKLDFIDRFASNDTTVLTAEDGRDYASVYEATDRLMTDIMAELRRAKPDVMIEFRQPYAGPLIRKYGNMLRAVDTPNSAIINRERIVNLRLLAGTTPVHADPIMWHNDEPAEIAAFQLLDTLFSVPQISMRLDALSPEHTAMLKNYLQYWHENRDVLLEGDLRPEGVYSFYPLITATNARKRIVGLYEDRVVALGDRSIKQIDVVNAKKTSLILLTADKNLGSYEILITDCYGVVRSRSRIELQKGSHLIEVPVSGIARLRLLQ